MTGGLLSGPVTGPKTKHVFENQKSLKSLRNGRYLWVNSGEEFHEVSRNGIGGFSNAETQILAGGGWGGFA